MTREDVLARRASLVEDRARHGRDFTVAYSALVDEWLRELFGPHDAGIALVAGGALGRQELAPGSDLDLVLLHDGRRDVAALADRIWYPIWDAGVALDHSVRTPKETVAMADRDLKVVLGLLDARLVAGDDDLARRTLEPVRDRWVRGARRRLPELDELTQARHTTEGDVAHLLEPDLKQGKGGLRDLRVLHAIAVGTPVGDGGDPALRAADDELLAVRVELHRVTGRGADRLGLEVQDAVAEQLGRDADALMADVARAARAIAWTSDDSWRRVRSWIAGPRGRRGNADRVVGPGLVLRDAELHLAADADLTDETLPLRAAGEAARLDVPLGRGVARHLADATFPGERSTDGRWSPAARNALVGLLGSGPGLVAVVDELDHHGLMTRILPEWEAVRSLPQRNALHRFTVDRHLVETAVQAAALTRTVGRPDLLLVGAWLHDLGKGSAGDHTDAGVALVGSIAPRLGFDPLDSARLVTLVRHHLLLPSVATSRDLDDPATIDGVAEAVGDVTTLELLVALTEADSLATGPGLWTSWKRQLVTTLARRVEGHLLGDEVPVAVEPPLTDELVELARASSGAVHVLRTDDRLCIAGPDRPGLLGILVGLLAVHGQSVRSALVTHDEHGTAVDVFEIEGVFGREPDWDRFRDDVVAALAGRYPLVERLQERSTRYARRAETARPAEPRVVVHPGASRSASVIEVRAADEVGLLSRIASTLGGLGLDIVQARALTLGHEAVDTFYLRDARTGAPVDDRGDEIIAAVLAVVREQSV